MLQALPALASEDKQFSAALGQVRFVPTQQLVDGVETLQMPSALYDPRVPELAALLDPSKCFPAPPFASQEVLGALQVRPPPPRGVSADQSVARPKSRIPTS